MQTHFKLNGLTCEACVKLSKKKLEKIYGVSEIDIDLKSGAATIEADREIKLEEVNSALTGTHYSAE